MLRDIESWVYKILSIPSMAIEMQTSVNLDTTDVS